MESSLPPPPSLSSSLRLNHHRQHHRAHYLTSKRRLFAILFILLQSWTTTVCSSSSSPGIIVRVRRVDGSMERIVVPEGTEQTMTLEQLLSSLHDNNNNDNNNNDNNNNIRLRIGDTVIDDLSRSISDLSLQNGALITLLAKEAKSTTTKSSSSLSSQTSSSASSARWDPFPDLAKDYVGALRQLKLQQQKSRGRSSYGDLAHLHSHLHVVEPQPQGPLLRVYMCRKAAERFQANGITTTAVAPTASKSRVQNRVGLLLGTIQRERKRSYDQKALPRTSLSSLPSDQEYCQVAKVHAIYEPPQQQSSTSYDASSLIDFHQNPTTRRVLELAKYLGLTPIGWIFTYSDDYRRQEESNNNKKRKNSVVASSDNDNNNKVPLVLAPDVVTGAQLEMANMKFLNDDRIEGKKFVTLAMDAISGATEAFQLSDVSVQMVSEGLLVMESSSNININQRNEDGEDNTSGRFVKTQHAIVVDGQETHQLDTWLCLINTALLSHEGDYCSTAISASAATSPVTKKNKLTTKTKKAIQKALKLSAAATFSESGDDRLLEVLADFSVLVALDQLLTKDEMERLCQLVHKWVRGQKRGTRIDSNLQLRLKSLLS